MRRNLNRALLLTLVGVACSSDKSSDPTVVANNFTSGTTLNGAMTVTGAMPNGNDNAAHITEIRLRGSGGPEISAATPITVTPGQPINIPLKWTGGAIAGFNVGFGGNSFFKIPMNPGPNMTAGSVTATGMLAGNVCDNLAETCHAIRCYEQVILPDGTQVSSQKLQMMVLDCSGGKGCGNNNNGGSCAFVNNQLGSVNFGNTACGQCYQNNCGPALTTCYGSAWMNGNFTAGGSCGPLYACVCNCQAATPNDQQMISTCTNSCFQQNQSGLQACSTCSQMFSTCLNNCSNSCSGQGG